MSSPDRWWDVRPRLPLALLTIYAALCALLLVIRIWSVTVNGGWAETTGVEGVPANLVFRVAAGASPYHDLSKDATSAVYNVAFYYVYGVAVRPAGTGPGALLYLRLLTLAITGTAAVVLARIARTRESNSPARGIASAMIGFSSICSPFSGWFPLSVRPDIAAFALEFLGTLLAWQGFVDVKRGRQFLYAGLAFGVALAFKQNTVNFLVATLAALTWHKRWRDAGAICFGPAIAAVVCLWAGGPFYLTHVLRGPAATPFSFGHFRGGVEGVLVGLPVFAGLILSRGLVPPTPQERSLSPYWLVATATLLVVPQLGRYGSTRNYLIDGMAIASVVVWTNALADAPIKPWRRYAIYATLAGQIAIVLAYWPPLRWGALTLPAAGDRPAAYRRAVATMRTPVFTDDQVAGFPWASGTVGAEMVDDTIYASAVRTGLVTTTIDDRISACYYGTLLLRDPSRIALAERSGYRIREALPDGVTYLGPSRECPRRH